MRQHFIILIVAALLLFFYTRGFVPHDEGWILHPAQRVLHGEIPYRDFHFIYTPGVLLLVEIIFRLFGENILATRLVAALIALLTAVLIYVCVKNIVKNKKLSLLASAMYMVWGSFHINFIWPTMIAIPLGLLSCFLLMRAIYKYEHKLFLLAGLIAGLTIFFKQNFGAAIVINNLLLFIFLYKKISLKILCHYLFGLLLGVFILFLYLVYKGAFYPFINDFYYFMYKKTILEGMQTTTFIDFKFSLRAIVKILFYLSPAFFSSLAIVVLKNTKNIGFPFAIFCLLFYIIGIRPTTDYLHLVPLVGLSGIPIAITIFKLKNTSLKLTMYVIAVCFIILGFYRATFGPYYRWEDPITKHSFFSGNPHMHILVDSKTVNVLEEATKYINTRSAKGDYIFIYDYLPMYYLILDRKNPTKFEYFPPIKLPEETDIVNDLKTKHVMIILTEHVLGNKSSILEKYIRNYYAVKKLNFFYYWELKKTQKPNM